MSGKRISNMIARPVGPILSVLRSLIGERAASLLGKTARPACPPMNRQAGSPSAKTGGTPVLLVMLGLAGLCAADVPANLSRVIGIEGDVAVTLPRGDYQARPLDDRTPLILRVEKITPAAGGRFTYQFHYMGFEAGDYRLANYLVRPDGSLAKEIGDEIVHVRSTLPADHDGALNPYIPRPFPWFGGYRMFLWILAVLWVGGIAAFAWFGRNRKPAVAPVVVVPQPSYAERMRPLVEAAAAGNLATNGQAELERLMTGYWREKLALPDDQRMADALAAHPKASDLE